MSTSRTAKRPPSRVGLTKSGRIDWIDLHNLSCLQLVDLGFSTTTISRYTGLTPSQVATRCRKAGRRIRDYRNGQNTQAELLINTWSVDKLTVSTSRKLRKHIFTPRKVTG